MKHLLNDLKLLRIHRQFMFDTLNAGSSARPKHLTFLSSKTEKSEAHKHENK